LVSSAQHEQFVNAFVRHQNRVYGYIVMMLPNRHDAEDVFQQTSLVLWQKWDQFDPAQDFVPWACGIAHNEIRNFLRRRGRSRVVFSEKLISELAVVRQETLPSLDERSGLLADCVGKLDFLARELLERCYAGRESIGVIARQFHTTANGIYLRLRKIRRELLECVEQKAHREETP
jgi:RNA polymerase sigma-70 factor, ECF subfamily